MHTYRHRQWHADNERRNDSEKKEIEHKIQCNIINKLPRPIYLHIQEFKNIWITHVESEPRHTPTINNTNRNHYSLFFIMLHSNSLVLSSEYVCELASDGYKHLQMTFPQMVCTNCQSVMVLRFVVAVARAGELSPSKKKSAFNRRRCNTKSNKQQQQQM